MFFLDLVRKTRYYFRESRRKVNFLLLMHFVDETGVLKIEIDLTNSIGRYKLSKDSKLPF
jgi:hypothetical protein